MSVLEAGLQISGFRLDGVAVIVVRGGLDTDAASSLRATFDGLAPDDHVYVECADVEYVDAAGLAVLSEVARRNVISGGPLHVHASSALRRFIEVSGVQHLFTLD